MRRSLPNFALGAVLLAVPVIAEVSTPVATALGFEVLLYVPFEFAFALAAMFLFTLLNLYLSHRNQESLWRGLALGVVIAAGWFYAAFLLIAELHTIRGGKM